MEVLESKVLVKEIGEYDFNPIESERALILLKVSDNRYQIFNIDHLAPGTRLDSTKIDYKNYNSYHAAKEAFDGEIEY